MSALAADLRYALRMLGRSPGFTVAAVLSLALGIGGNTTIFTWVNAVLLDPLPGVADPGRLAVLTTTDPRESFTSLSYLDYLDYRQSPVLAGLVAQDELAMSLGADGRADRVWGLLVSENYFDVLGVRPALGRAFLPEEGRAAGAGPVVVISHSLWQRRFAGDPSVVGRKVTLNTHPFTVVGVAPPAFRGSVVGLALEAWVPLSMQPQLLGGDRLSHRGNRWLQALARLKPGIELGQAQAQLAVTARRLAETHGEDRGLGVALYRFWNAPTGGTRILGPVLKVLMAVVALVLLIACANVANLLLARATARRREIAVRVSLGAGRRRLVRQLLTESLLLALLGGAAAVLVTFWSAGLLEAFAPPTDLPVALDPRVDGRALLFALAVSVLTAVLFGLAPALHATRSGLAPALRDETGAVAGGRGRTRLRGALVAGQVALSLLLLVGAGLLLRSLHNAQSVDPGFNPRGVLIASVDLLGNGYDRERGRQFYRAALERVRALPGVASATLTRRAPLGFGGSSSTTVRIEGYDPPAGQPAWAFYHQVGSDYFRTIETPLTSGRDLGDQDVAGAPGVLMVNETMARRYWPGRDPVGGRVELDEGAWFTVVGVVRDAKYRLLNEPPAPHMFLPIQQVYRPLATLLVRADGDPSALAPAVTAQLQAVDRNLPVFDVRTLEQHISASSFQQRLAGWLLAAFGGLALTLAALGLYGVLAYVVGQRTREIGVRMALGGRRRDIFRLIVAQGLRFSLLGVGLGLLAAAGLTRALSSLLLGVSPLDAPTFATVGLLLLSVATLACALPARRAMNVNPVTALRHE